MAIRKKLISYKNYLSIQTFYVKRHAVRVKKLVQAQYIQQGFRCLGKRAASGNFLLTAGSAGRLKPDHLDAFSRVIVRKFFRLFRLWTVLRFTEMVTAKPNEIRMGKGKGAFAFWSKSISSGVPILEIGFIRWFPNDFVFHVIRRLRAKFPIKLNIRQVLN